MVADFGIALALGVAGGTRLTETGLSVGTPFYMSPEQATGDQAVGASTDTYALGAVLYEMLVGEPPYPGATAQAVLGKIIAGKPVSATEQRPSIPANVDAAVRKALEKLPADRFQTANEYARALADPAFRHGTVVGVADGGSTGPWKLAAIGLGLLAALTSGGLLLALNRPTAPTPVIRYTMDFAEGEEPVTGNGAFGTSMGISNDGSTLAYIGPAGETTYQLWVRERDELSGRPIVGTGAGVQPFFSPDGSRVGFIVTGTRQLKIASLGGEPPLTLVDSLVYRLGAAWGPDGHIYFCALPDGALYRVPVGGGASERVSEPDSTLSETRHAWPDPLPNGRGILLTVQRGDNAYTPEDDVGVLNLETGQLEILFRATLARYHPSGHIVFVTHEGDLMAAPFDQDRLEVTGPTVPLLSGMAGNVRGPDVALSRSGRLVYEPTAPPSEIEPVWVDRAGRATPVEEGWTVNISGSGAPALSPDDSRIALQLDGEAGGTEVWIKEIGGPLSRLAFGGVNARVSWAGDGISVVYLTESFSPTRDLASQRADGSGVAEILLDLESPLDDSRWTPDGEWMVMRIAGQGIYAMRPSVDSVPIPLVAGSQFVETTPRVSPNGRFLAYTSNVSGQFEIYVRPFPDAGRARVAISTDGGVEPLWANSGRELFYKNTARELVSVQVDTEGDLRVLGRESLFSLPPGASLDFSYTQYDVTQDDQRFLMYRLAGGVPAPVTDSYIVVENFHEELEARVSN